MDKAEKIILIPILFVIFTFIFLVLENGLADYQFNQVIQPIIFAAALVSNIFYPQIRKYTIQLSLFLLILMVITYMFNSISISNWFGSLGFGLLFITVFSYLPQLIKKGFVEKY